MSHIEQNTAILHGLVKHLSIFIAKDTIQYSLYYNLVNVFPFVELQDVWPVLKIRYPAKTSKANIKSRGYKARYAAATKGNKTAWTGRLRKV